MNYRNEDTTIMKPAGGDFCLFQIISRNCISNPSSRDSTEGMIHFHHSQGVYQAAKLHKGHNKRTDIAKSYGQNIRARGLHRF